MTLGIKKVLQRIDVAKSKVFQRIRYDFTSFDTGFSQKSELFFIFVTSDVLFVVF